MCHTLPPEHLERHISIVVLRCCHPLDGCLVNAAQGEPLLIVIDCGDGDPYAAAPARTQSRSDLVRDDDRAVDYIGEKFKVQAHGSDRFVGVIGFLIC